MVFISDSDYKSDYVEKYVFNDDATADYLNKNFVCMFLDANSKQGDAAMTKYELEESFPGFMLFNSKGEFKGCAGALCALPRLCKRHLICISTTSRRSKGYRH